MSGKRLLSLLTSLALLSVLMLSVIPVPARAAASTLTIKAGYFGLPYATKAEYTAGEIEAMGVHSALYTMNSNGGFLSYANAEGVYLKDILSSAGVNVSSISYVNFQAEDSHNASKNYYYNTLFGTRYAFPALSQYYGQLEGVTNEGLVWESAVQVKTMLAVRDNFSRVDDFSEYEPADMTNSHRFRLMIGQAYPGEVVAVDSIYKVNTVIVTYAGSPEIDAESEVVISIDDDHNLVYSVSSADSDITRMIAEGLKFKSSDSSIVSVDENGRLTAKRAGEVEITIYYESTDIDAADIYTTVRVRVGESDGNGGNGTGDGLGDGSGDGSGSGESGNGETQGNGGGSVGQGNSQPATNPDQNEQTPGNKDSADGQVTNGESDDTPENVYVSTEIQTTVRDYTLQVRRVNTGQANTGAAPEISDNGSTGGAEGGSEALGLSLDRSMLLIAALLAVLLFVGGGVGQYVQFRKEMLGDRDYAVH